VRDRLWLGMPVSLLAWAAPLMGGLVAIAGFVLALMPNETLAAVPDEAAAVVRNLDAVLVSVLIGAGVIALIWGSLVLPILRHSQVGALVLLIPFVGILNAATHLSVVPAMDPLRSAASFGQAVDRQWNRDERLVELNNQKDGIVTYYCNVQRVEILAGKDDADTGRRVMNISGPLWVVARRKDWSRLPELARAPFTERASAMFNSNEHVLMYRRQ
jgi:hypothetical protein